MTRIDGRQIAALARGLHDLDLSEARAQALAEMVSLYAEAAARSARPLPMEAEPALYSLALAALRQGDRR